MAQSTRHIEPLLPASATYTRSSALAFSFAIATAGVGFTVFQRASALSFTFGTQVGGWDRRSNMVGPGRHISVPARSSIYSTDI